MRKLYLVAKNHMDPSWLRCFTDHFNNKENGDVIRPYSDMEEIQILEYLDFAEKYGVKYQLEQSLVVKEFLKRNPDQKERFKALVQKGLIELAGGGETVIDVNLTQGESWARNHLYSREYYKKEFDHAPRYAITPDIFGLAAQLPQFFRSVGYDALIIFDRVLLNNKPFWKGLDGTFIVLDNKFLQPPQPGLRTADCVKLPACQACHGEGCELCEGTGIAISYNMTRPDKELLREAYFGNMSAGEMLQKLIDLEDKDEYYMMITTEEPRIGDFLYGQLNEVAESYGFEICYQTFEENHDNWCKGQVEALRNGNFTEDEIDTRVDGNPAGCGCYSSRIEIKKANRELEDLLLEAERLAVLAKMQGGWDTNAVPRRDFPQKKLAELWSKMAFIQFHDCVTGSHCDASYYELLRYIRETRRGAEQIYNDAALEILRTVNCDIPEGFKAAIYFNMDTVADKLPRVSIHAPAGTENLEIYDTECNKLQAFDTEVIPEFVGTAIRATVQTEVPPLGWKIFLWKPLTEKETLSKADYMSTPIKAENDYFTVTADKSGIKEIFDKKNNRTILSGAGISLSTDTGSPWGRDVPEEEIYDLTADSVYCETAENFSKIIFKGVLSDAEKNVNNLGWTQTVTLNKSEDIVRFRTELDWDGTNTRVSAFFTPAFENTGKLLCEVPFGTVERDDPPEGACLGLTDEWASIGFAGVTSGEYNVAVLKGGFPGTKLKDGRIKLSILRSFTYGAFNGIYSETSDVGRHVSEYAITAWEGTFAEGNCSAKAASFNKHGHTHELNKVNAECEKAGEKSLFPEFTNLPKGLRLSALKLAEDCNGTVIRFWESAGLAPTITMPEGIRLIQCNTLEERISDAEISEYSFRPFEIATFRIIKK